MLGTSWPMVHIAFAKQFSGEQVTDADIRAWVTAKLASGELAAPSDKVQANVSASYYDETPFGSFPVLFHQVAKGKYVVLAESEFTFKANSRGTRQSATASNPAVLAALAPKQVIEQEPTEENTAPTGQELIEA